MALLAGAVSGFAQGQISMFDYGATFAIQVFTASPLAASTVPVSYGGLTVLEQQGNDAGNDNPGSASYAGTPLGNGYDVQLLAGPAGTLLANLTPVANSLVTTWNTGSEAGYWNSTALATITGVTSTAAVAIAAWNNEGGTITTLAGAEATPNVPWGVSSEATTSALGFGSQQPPFLPAGLTSFSLGTTPEPSTIALGVIGASAFLMRLRRKQ